MAQTCTLGATGEAHTIPAWTRIRQRFDRTALADVPATTQASLDASGIALKPGWSVAITVGSRGIANIAPLTRAIADWCRAQGAEPFVVPSMGTHGGATAEGQREMIEGLGCTEVALGCPIRSTMETVELDRGTLPCPVLHDKLAAGADAVIVVNRIKPHTQVGTAAFLDEQPFQSGLFKMLVIGLGNNDQAVELHAGNYPKRMCQLMPAVARRKIELSCDGSARCNVVGGVAIVENAYDQTMVVEAMGAADIERREPELLKLACKHMPTLPSDRLDVLLLDHTGKNVSGTGMDTNIVGRVLNPSWDGFREPTSPVIKAIGVHRLADASHGNGGGMGLADIVSRRFFEALDLELTWKHMISCNWTVGGKIPVVAGTDAEVYLACARTAGVRDLATARAVRVQNTLKVGECWVSPPLLNELQDRADIEVLEGGLTAFDDDGNLKPFEGAADDLGATDAKRQKTQ